MKRNSSNLIGDISLLDKYHEIETIIKDGKGEPTISFGRGYPTDYVIVIKCLADTNIIVNVQVSKYAIAANSIYFCNLISGPIGTAQWTADIFLQSEHIIPFLKMIGKFHGYDYDTKSISEILDIAHICSMYLVSLEKLKKHVAQIKYEISIYDAVHILTNKHMDTNLESFIHTIALDVIAQYFKNPTDFLSSPEKKEALTTLPIGIYRAMIFTRDIFFDCDTSRLAVLLLWIMDNSDIPENTANELFRSIKPREVRTSYLSEINGGPINIPAMDKLTVTHFRHIGHPITNLVTDKYHIGRDKKHYQEFIAGLIFRKSVYMDNEYVYYSIVIDPIINIPTMTVILHIDFFLDSIRICKQKRIYTIKGTKCTLRGDSDKIVIPRIVGNSKCRELDVVTLID